MEPQLSEALLWASTSAIAAALFAWQAASAPQSTVRVGAVMSAVSVAELVTLLHRPLTSTEYWPALVQTIGLMVRVLPALVVVIAIFSPLVRTVAPFFHTKLNG